jgi:hypothetical protein
VRLGDRFLVDLHLAKRRVFRRVLRVWHRHAGDALGEALQRRQYEYHERGYHQAPNVTKIGRQQLLCPFGKYEHDRHNRCRERRLFDGPANTQVDVEEMRTQDAIGNERNCKQRAKCIDKFP